MSGRDRTKSFGTVVVMVLALSLNVRAETVWRTLFADQNWYLEAIETEQVLSGQLQRHTPPGGPAGRGALAYALAGNDGVIPIYAPGRREIFESLLGQQVEIEGKLVDLMCEGFGVELWPARISDR